MYATPQLGQGFSMHVDTHDVFVLQLHGSKKWQIGEPERALPLAARDSGPVGNPGQVREYVLRPGDVLYLPRGYPHQAVTSDESSLHLTVGVHAFRWHDFMVEALKAVAEQRVDFREALPAGFLDEGLDSSRIGALAQGFCDMLRSADVVEQVRRAFEARLVQQGTTGVRGQFSAIDTLPNLTDDSRIERPADQLCRVRSSPAEAILEFLGNYVAGPPHLQTAYEFIASRHVFAVKDIPGSLTSADRKALVARLVSEGLLKPSP
jgi:ribosomal protein L16 Arg81 hydroxylase